MCREEKAEEPEAPKYRDRAKERREDQNPDYEATELGSFHAVAPPGPVDLRSADAQKFSIEKSKYLGGASYHHKEVFPIGFGRRKSYQVIIFTACSLGVLNIDSLSVFYLICYSGS